MAKSIHFSFDDLTKSAMKRIIEQLVVADEGEEQKILAALDQKKRKSAEKSQNDLADLVEEKRGKPREIDPMDEEAEEEDG